MSIVINRDGKQLGPYSLEQARALVLAGQIDADDWAWPDGATAWVQLKDVPGFAAVKSPLPPPSGLAGGAVASAAVFVAEEEELWHGHPSQILNLPIYIFWVVVLIFAAGVAIVLWQDASFWALIIFAVVALVALAQSAWAYFHLKMHEYIITSQRVRVISGLFSKDVQEIELFRVKDTSARQSVLLRLFGLGTIRVVSADHGHPVLLLDGVPNAIEMRERIRHEVISLRQRLGVREVDVM